MKVETDMSYPLKNSQNHLNGSTVLIVDDHPTNLSVAVDALSELGTNVLVASSGRRGLERAEYARPDLILLDIMMPDIDGLEVCCRLKKKAATQAIPVIFMTALTDTVDKVKGLQAGGID